MEAGRAAAMQLQVRRNAEDLQDYMKGLESWEDEIKQKEEKLIKQKPILKEQFPPVRSQQQLIQQHKRKKKKKLSRVSASKAPGSSRIRSYDYRSWDKFDVDKACEEVDYQVQSSSSSFESESDEENEMKSKSRQRALEEKEKGNELFKKKNYELAVESYARAMELDPGNAVFPANRAMALLKLERYAAAECDCSLALELDPSYLKAFLRRGTARCKLKKLVQARGDFEAVLKIEPGNSVALSELDKLDKEIGTAGMRYIRAVKRPEHMRSKKPLKRILIEDIESITSSAETEKAIPAATMAAEATSVSTTVAIATPTEVSESAIATTAACSATASPDVMSTAATSATADVTAATSSPARHIAAYNTTVATLEEDTAYQGNAAATLSEQHEKHSDSAATSSVQPTASGDSLSAHSSKAATPPATLLMASNGQAAKNRDSMHSSSISVSHSIDTNTSREDSGDSMKASDPQRGSRDTRMIVTTSGSVEQDLGNEKHEQRMSIPPVPSSSFQFQTDWKLLKGKHSLRSRYFKAISPHKYPAILQQSLETDVFQDVIAILHEDYVKLGKTCLAQLSALAKVNRFSVAVMFLSKKQKDCLQLLFRDLLCLLSSEEEKQKLFELAKQFGVPNL